MIARERPTASTTAGATEATTLPTGSPGPATPHVVARLLLLDPGLYAFSLSADAARHEAPSGFVLPAVQLCSPPGQGEALEITDGFGRTGSWLGGRHRVLFVKSPAGGAAALVTGYLPRELGSAPLQLDIRRIAPPDPAVTTLRMGGPAATQGLPQQTGREIIAHIRGRGDVSFRDAPWAGCLGAGSWIEGFVISPSGGPSAAAVEYKGLSADGTETPWIDSGGFCGTRGRGLPLIGFAVRQKAVPGGAPVDCEYSGYFQSGAIAGPARNGAPCRSAIERDPLEGLQLRIILRAAAGA